MGFCYIKNPSASRSNGFLPLGWLILILNIKRYAENENKLWGQEAIQGYRHGENSL